MKMPKEIVERNRWDAKYKLRELKELVKKQAEINEIFRGKR